MAHKKKHAGPVPPDNQSQPGPAQIPGQSTPTRPKSPGEVESSQEQDAKRRFGDFSGTGEHPRQQPSRLNDGEQHSR